jgi:hypothetical protein
MPNTTVGLFENPSVVPGVVREIEALGVPRKEVRVLDEPSTFEVTGIMSFGRLEFEVDLNRELARIGATTPEAQAYVEGLQRGGELVFATGSAEQVEKAAAIMNRHGAVEIEEMSGPEPHLPRANHEKTMATSETSVLTGRIRQADGGACIFVW